MISVVPTPLQLSRRSGLPYHELRRMIATVTSQPIHPGESLRPEIVALTEDLIHRRQAGTPLQYLEGYAEFGPVRVAVDRRGLIPRPETEQLWELAVDLNTTTPPEVIVDMGTGTGALALALSHSYPKAQVLATDICPQALELAARNLAKNSWATDRIQLLAGDLFEALPESLRGRVDLLASNPPYVASDEWNLLPAEVRAEPRRALVAGARGTEVLERLAAGARPWLKSSGMVVVEIGETQGDIVQDAFVSHGMQAEVHCDLTGRPRFVVGRPTHS